MSVDESWKLSDKDLMLYRKHVQTLMKDELQESLIHLQEHKLQLETLLNKLLLAKKQVTESVTASRQQVKQSCMSLLQLLTETVNSREAALLEELKKLEQQSLSPLLDCEEVLAASLQHTEQLLQCGAAFTDDMPGHSTNDNSLCKLSAEDARDNTTTHKPEGSGFSVTASATNTPLITRDRIINFQKEASLDNCLPSVPELSSVPFVSVVFSPTINVTLPEILAGWGRISKRGPVQITEVQERPGSLLVLWEEVRSVTPADEDDEEDSVVCRVFVLQCSSEGQDGPYSTVYRGTEDHYLLQHRQRGRHYWVRVAGEVFTGRLRGQSVAERCHRRPQPCLESSCYAMGGTVPQGDGGQEEQGLTAWSLPRQCSTLIPHYEWKDNPVGWRVADDGRVATRGDGGEVALVVSSGATLTSGSTLVMQVVRAGVCCSDEGLALSWRPPASPQHLTAPGAVFLSAAGRVLVDGATRLMLLPALTDGSCVTFGVEVVAEDRLRLHVETQDKQVTYEWPVPLQHRSHPALYFSACFAAKDWVLRVY